MVHDAHCHFFSTRFFEALARDVADLEPGDPVSALTTLLGWEPPGEPADLADRWVKELDKHDVSRAALMASVPGDEESVAVAVARHPRRFVGWFMLDPTREDAVGRAEKAIGQLGLRCVCLFPAMHRYWLDDARVLKVFEIAAAHAGTAVFVHCGVLAGFKGSSATRPRWCESSSSLKASDGVFQPRVFRGRRLSVAATAATSLALCRLRSVPLGKYWRSRPLVFSFVPRCHGLRGSQKKTCSPVSIRS